MYIESLDTYKPGSCVNVGYECSSYDEFSLVNTLYKRKECIKLHNNLGFCTLTNFVFIIFQGLCFKCGPENKHCAKLGYPSIEYMPIAQKYLRTGVKFYLNTGSIAPFCRRFFFLRFIFSHIDKIRCIKG